MNDEKKEFLKSLAEGNPAELDKVIELQKVLSELEQAGIFRQRPYSVTPPLGRLSELRRPTTLANASSKQPAGS